MRAQVPTIARATFLEAVRDRVLLLVVVFTLAVVLVSRVLGWLSVDDDLKIVQDLSLSALNALALLLAMLVGAFALAREVERRTVYPLLSRDLTRGEFVLGKYFGLVAAFWICLAGSAAALAIWLAAWGKLPTAGFLAAVLGLMSETLLLTAVALFLGALMAPTVAAVGTCLFALAAHSTEVLREMTESGRSPQFDFFYSLLYRLMPNLEDVNFINVPTAGVPVRWGDLALGSLAVALWSAVFLVAAIALFRRREV